MSDTPENGSGRPNYCQKELTKACWFPECECPHPTANAELVGEINKYVSDFEEIDIDASEVPLVTLRANELLQRASAALTTAPESDSDRPHHRTRTRQGERKQCKSYKKKLVS